MQKSAPKKTAVPLSTRLRISFAEGQKPVRSVKPPTQKKTTSKELTGTPRSSSTPIGLGNTPSRPIAYTLRDR